MATLYRARVCAVGDAEDMLRLNRALLKNRDWLEEPEDRPPMKLEALVEQVRRHAQWEGDDHDEFLYEMIAPVPYGEANAGSCRYTLRQEPCGLWTACFAYESDTAFQGEDWLALHKRCDRIPMMAMRAAWDFARDKGLMIFTGGHIQEDWSLMAEAWLWLIQQYECGYPPEEAIRRLEKLGETMEREDCDLSVAELLRSCMDNLRRLGDVGDITPEALEGAKARRDFEALFDMQMRVAASALWETEHNARWIACLEATLQAWENR